MTMEEKKGILLNDEQKKAQGELDDELLDDVAGGVGTAVVTQRISKSSKNLTKVR